VTSISNTGDNTNILTENTILKAGDKTKHLAVKTISNAGDKNGPHCNTYIKSR
jgi:hypothetical protein